MRKKGLFSFYMLVLFLPCLELAFRIVGYRPYEQLPFSIESQPEFCIVPDARMGFALQPGTFEVDINQGLRYTATHGPDSLRISDSLFRQHSLPQIFLMGCSYTYGWGLNDTETFAHLIQKQFPQYQIRNFGVPGFGTVQSYLQLQGEIEKGNVPEQVIINYADFHDERNALTPLYRKHLYMGFERSNKQLPSHFAESKIPYVVQEGEGFNIAWIGWREIYSNWRGRELFALVNFIQDGIDRIASQRIHSRTHSLFAFQLIQELCAKYKIPLLVSGLTQTVPTQDMLKALDNMNIEAVDISVDLDSPAFNNTPFDTHPNARAHTVFAEKLFLLVGR